jgi:N-glycosylase/DNA lyase
MKSLIRRYHSKKNEIRKRLSEFKRKFSSDDSDIFSELCFCVFTPGSKALKCYEAVRELNEAGLLYRGDAGKIGARIKSKVRFHNNKASYLVAARRFFKSKGGFDIKSKIDASDVIKTREWFVKNIKGLGYKEASHFLRNIGLGRDIAILDRHILKNLKRYGVIKKIPSALNKKTYLDIEEKIKSFSRGLHIPMDELDLLFWSMQTGHIFK